MGKSDLIEKINARANTTKKPQQVVKRVNNSSSSEEREEKDTGEKRITNSRGTVVVRRRVPNPPKQEDSATFVSDNEENNAEPKMLTNPPSNDEKTGSSDIKLALQDETDDSDRILELENKSETPNSNLDSYDDELVPVAQNESTTDDADGYASYDISDSQDLLTHSSLEREHSAAQLSTEKFATSPLQEDGIVTDDSPVTQLDNTAVNQQKNSNSLYEEREQKFRDLTSVAEQSDVTLKKQQEQTKNLKPLRKDHQSSFKSETKISDTLNTSKDISSAKEVTFAKKEHNKNSTENLFSTKKILTIEDVLAEEHGHVPIQNKALIVGEVRKSSPKIPLKTINKQHLQNSVADIQSEKKKPVTKLEESPKPKFNDSDNKDISETSSRVSDDKLKTVTSTKDVASNDRTNEKTSSQHPLGSVASNNTTQNNTQNNQVHNSQSNNLKKEHKYDTKVDNNVSRNQDLNQRNLRPQNNGPRSQFSNTRQEQNSSSTTNNDKHFESTPHNQHASHQNQATYTNQNSNYSGNLQSDPRAKTLGKNEAFSTMAAALGTLATKNNLPAGKKTIAPTAFKEIVNEEKKREKASTKGRFSKNDFVEDVKAVRGLQQKKVLKKKEVFQPKRDVTTPEVESQFRKFKKTSIKREKAKTKITTPKAIKRLLKIEDTISVSELAHLMSVKAPLLIKKLISLGVMATINQVIDFDTASLLAVEFGYEVENVTFNEDNILNVSDSINEENDLPRPPVVTIMGHVDHGKTTLLDAIRHTDIAGKEAGGITQHIGAYRVETESGQIVFLDTPGHEAFTAMRSRGVKVTDIVILVVAADDGVMPQTVEALNHAKAANVPIIVAINKIDKPGANADRIRQKLAEHELVSEEWGGQTIFAEVSAKSKKGVKELLELILLQAEVLELKANPYRQARATVVESQLDKGKGPLATVLVAQGTLKVGDIVVVGCHYGKIRAMVDDHGKQSKEAGPSIPVEILGLSGVPDAGDTLAVVDDMDVAKSIAENRQEKLRQQQMAKVAKVSLEDLFTQMEKGEVKELKIVLKTDVQGSLEALQKAITDIGTDSVKTQILHAGVGTISEGDVMLASASKAVVLGFNVKADVNALALAERECIQINTYSIIYDAIDHLKKAMLGLLKPVMKEKIIGHAEVRNIFSIPKIGFIAGCSVIDGKIVRNSSIRVMRNAKQVWEGKLASLRRFKDDVKEVEKGYECGIALENYTDLQMNDILEAYIMEEQRPTL